MGNSRNNAQVFFSAVSCIISCFSAAISVHLLRTRDIQNQFVENAETLERRFKAMETSLGRKIANIERTADNDPWQELAMEAVRKSFGEPEVDSEEEEIDEDE